MIAAVALGALAVFVFVLQVNSFGDQTTARETLLFNALEFVLTVGFAWFSTRAVSRSEFEDSIKRFAISACRRIADIERMILRLQGEVRETLVETSSAEEVSALEVVDAIVGDTVQVVRSSISDWADVIGNELLALEKLKRLQSEHDEVAAASENFGDALREDSAARIASLEQSRGAHYGE